MITALRKIFRAMYLEYLVGRREEVRHNRMYLVQQSADAHRTLDEQEKSLSEKIEKFTP